MPDPEGAELAELRARVEELEKEVELLRSRPAQPGLDAGMAEDLLAELRTASQGRRRLLTQLLQVLGTDVDHLS